MTALVRGDWDDVRRVATDAAKPLSSRLCGLTEANGRVLADAIRALVDLPLADVSAMDGWAVAGDGPWQVSGRVLNGAAPRGPLVEGQAVGIGTGGVVPRGTTAIVRREHGDVVGQRLRWSPPAGGGLGLKDVRPRGDEARCGDVMIPAGTRLDAMSLALAASVGHDELAVAALPEVEVLVTGGDHTAVEQCLASPRLMWWVGRLDSRWLPTADPRRAVLDGAIADAGAVAVDVTNA